MANDGQGPISFGRANSTRNGQDGIRWRQEGPVALNSRYVGLDPQARNLDVADQGAVSLDPGIPVLRRNIRQMTCPAWPQRRELRGISWEACGIRGGALPVGACPVAANCSAIGGCGMSMCVPWASLPVCIRPRDEFRQKVVKS